MRLSSDLTLSPGWPWGVKPLLRTSKNIDLRRAGSAVCRIQFGEILVLKTPVRKRIDLYVRFEGLKFGLDRVSKYEKFVPVRREAENWNEF